MKATSAPTFRCSHLPATQTFKASASTGALLAFIARDHRPRGDKWSLTRPSSRLAAAGATGPGRESMSLEVSPLVERIRACRHRPASVAGCRRSLLGRSTPIFNHLAVARTLRVHLGEGTEVALCALRFVDPREPPRWFSSFVAARPAESRRPSRSSLCSASPLRRLPAPAATQPSR